MLAVFAMPATVDTFRRFDMFDMFGMATTSTCTRRGVADPSC